MGANFSTALINNMMSKQAAPKVTYTASTIAAVNGSPPTLTDSANGFLTAGFRAGDAIVLIDGHNNNVNYILGVAAGVLTLENAVTAFSAGTAVTLITFTGGGFLDLFENCVLAIYSGAQPAGADAAENGTLLLLITLASGSFAGGSPANGLNFASPAIVGVLSKGSGIWSGNAVASGTAAWFRLYSNGYNVGADAGLVWNRMDGSIGISGSGADLIVATTALTAAAPYTVDAFTVTLPQSGT
ncbi:MAG: hypothetical protein ACLQBD_01120 [Syntrophobacteraceae bacterium]